MTRERLVEISNCLLVTWGPAVYLCRHLVEMDEIRVKPMVMVIED